MTDDTAPNFAQDALNFHLRENRRLLIENEKLKTALAHIADERNGLERDCLTALIERDVAREEYSEFEKENDKLQAVLNALVTPAAAGGGG